MKTVYLLRDTDTGYGEDLTVAIEQHTENQIEFRIFRYENGDDRNIATFALDYYYGRLQIVIDTDHENGEPTTIPLGE
jgi:hypothetical protein